MTTSKTIAILIRLAADWRREELQLCKQFGDVIIPQSMRERRIKETKAIDAAVEMINRLEAAERDVALKEKVIDALGSELNAVAKERDELRAKIEAMEQQEPVAWTTKLALELGSSALGFDACRGNLWGEKGVALYALPGAQGEEK